MLPFSYHVPTEIVFGEGSVQALPSLAKKYGAHRLLLHYGSERMVKNGQIPQMEEALRQVGIEVFRFGGAVPNPRVALVREGARFAQENCCDFILGVGGGSAIDSAKAIAIAGANPGIDVWDFWARKQKPEKALPVGVILTLSATGTETSASSVLNNEDEGQKRGLTTPLNRPCFSILDPTYTLSLPPYQVACGVVDIMQHTMERFFTPEEEGNNLTDALATALLRTVIQEGAKAYRNPKNYGPMSELMWAGSLSHNGLTGLGASGDWATHQLGHVLSLLYDVAHGASLSAVWPAWARYASQRNAGRFVKYAEQVWGIQEGTAEEKVEAGIAKTLAFWKSLNLPTSLSELQPGLELEDARKLATYASYQGTRTIGTYPILDQAAMEEIYRNAL